MAFHSSSQRCLPTLTCINFRAAADLEDHIKPSLPTLPSGSKPIIASTGIVNQSDDAELFKKQSYKDKNSEFLRFCKAIRTIERERIRLRERIQVVVIIFNGKCRTVVPCVSNMQHCVALYRTNVSFYHAVTPTRRPN